jgi:hypothetical protein
MLFLTQSEIKPQTSSSLSSLSHRSAPHYQIFIPKTLSKLYQIIIIKANNTDLSPPSSLLLLCLEQQGREECVYLTHSM